MQKLNKDADVHKELGYVFDALTETRKALDGNATLIGFCGGPVSPTTMLLLTTVMQWTVMAYMVEGGGTKLFSKAKKWLYLYKEGSHELLDLVRTSDPVANSSHGSACALVNRLPCRSSERWCSGESRC